MKRALFWALGIVWSITGIATAQPVPSEKVKLNLLPGYHQREGGSLDSTTGTIWKDGGLRISYDVGALAGVYTECRSCGWIEGEIWRKQQLLKGRQAVIVLTRSRRLVVSFPEERANFYATVRNESDMADMLLMIATFESAAKP